MGEGVSPPVLDGDSFPVGNNSMPPVASPRLGTSGCDYPGRIEFDKTQTKFFEIPPCAGAVTCDILLRMGQQLRQRAKRNRRKAYAKRVNARLLAAKKAK